MRRLLKNNSDCISVGCLGNFLVLITIMRAPDMRSARNVFIGNLALSDLCLCVVTMPLTLVRQKYYVSLHSSSLRTALLFIIRLGTLRIYTLIPPPLNSP